MIEVARKVIIVADHTPGRNAMIHLHCWKWPIMWFPMWSGREYCEMLRRRGVEVLLAVP